MHGWMPPAPFPKTISRFTSSYSRQNQLTTLRRRSVRPPQIAELAGDDVIVPALADRPADQLLVAAIAIGVRCIEEVDAEFTGAADRVDRRCRIGLAIKWRHCRAA